MLWKIQGRELFLRRTLLMGILNVTPDSFSDGGKYVDPEQAVLKGLQLIEDGADILDLGGESTRPNADPVSEEDEIQRVLPVLRGIRENNCEIPISIDTTKPGVARICLENGAHIINDVSGLEDSGGEMAETVSRFGAGLVLMHRRGNPLTMQSRTHYGSLIDEVSAEIEGRIERAIKSGVKPEQLVIDPGLGFSKTTEQNLLLLKNLEAFHSFGLPVLLGPSRKSYIGEVTGRPVSQRDWATAAVVALAVSKGVQILRVHEAGFMRDAANMAEAIRGEDYVRSFQVGKYKT